MILRVGPYLYRVNFVPDYIQHEGQPCLGLCDNDQQLITVCQRVSEAEQIQVLCHEYMEAWLYHFGRSTRDKEDYCDLFGMAMAQFITDLTHQLRVLADRPSDPVAAKAMPCGPPSRTAPIPQPRRPSPARLRHLPSLTQAIRIKMAKRIHRHGADRRQTWVIRRYQPA